MGNKEEKANVCTLQALAACDIITCLKSSPDNVRQRRRNPSHEPEQKQQHLILLRSFSHTHTSRSSKQASSCYPVLKTQADGTVSVHDKKPFDGATRSWSAQWRSQGEEADAQAALGVKSTHVIAVVLSGEREDRSARVSAAFAMSILL